MGENLRKSSTQELNSYYCVQHINQVEYNVHMFDEFLMNEIIVIIFWRQRI